MATINTVPGSICLTLLALLSALSFAPQLLRLASRGDASGISLVYVLFHLISATQQLMIGGIYIGFAEQTGLFVWSWPQSITDRINLAQLLIVWVGMLLLLIACLSTSPHAPRLKALVILIYLVVLLLTLVPLAMVLNDPAERKDGEHSTPFLAHDLLLVAHIQFVVPVVTFLAAAALYPEARAIVSRPRGDIGSLSPLGLAVQALVFAAVAVSWLFRVKWPIPGTVPITSAFSWYRLVGWAAVNNAIFSAVQGLLFWLVYTRTLRTGMSLSPSSETNPLLGRK